MHANQIESVFFAKQYRADQYPSRRARRRAQFGLVDRRPPGAGQRPEPRNRFRAGGLRTSVGRLAAVTATIGATVAMVVAILVSSGGSASAATLSRYPTPSVSAHPNLGLQHPVARAQAHAALISRWHTD